LQHDGTLDIDGCNVLPVLKGQAKVVRFHDGAERDTLYFHYPVLNGAFSTVQRDGWKLMKNTGIHMNKAPEIQLFNLEKDLGETTNLADQYPEVKKQLLADLDKWLEKYDAGVPYNNAAYKKGDLPGQKKIPAVTGRGSKGDRLWATFETGAGKARITEAFLLHTVNGGKMLSRHGSHEEWFRAPAKLSNGRVEGTAPAGMTHGVFCLVDANNFLIHSEPVPVMTKHGIGESVSLILADGYAWRPGLVSLIHTGVSAMANAEKAGLDTSALKRAIEEAEQTVAQAVNENIYAPAIRNLRREIRVLDVPESRLAVLNLFQAQNW
jgi:hypothetical protein